MAHRAIMSLSKNIPKQMPKDTKSFKNLLVVDFEATCIEKDILKPQEIIEFPCIVVSTKDWEVKNVFHEYVKPRVHPELSPFCTQLTGIMQETIEKEEYFPNVFDKFCNWLEEGKYFDKENESAFVTCGDWDLKVMLPQQCELDDIEVPNYFKHWINLKTTFCKTTTYYPRSLPDMLKYLKMGFHGREHSGIDDVHNMVRVIQTLANRFKSEFKITTKSKIL